MIFFFNSFFIFLWKLAMIFLITFLKTLSKECSTQKNSCIKSWMRHIKSIWEKCRNNPLAINLIFCASLAFFFNFKKKKEISLIFMKEFHHPTSLSSSLIIIIISLRIVALIILNCIIITIISIILITPSDIKINHLKITLCTEWLLGMIECCKYNYFFHVSLQVASRKCNLL